MESVVPNRRTLIIDSGTTLVSDLKKHELDINNPSIALIKIL